MFAHGPARFCSRVYSRIPVAHLHRLSQTPTSRTCTCHHFLATVWLLLFTSLELAFGARHASSRTLTRHPRLLPRRASAPRQSHGPPPPAAALRRRRPAAPAPSPRAASSPNARRADTRAAPPPTDACLEMLDAARLFRTEIVPFWAKPPVRVSQPLLLCSSEHAYRLIEEEETGITKGSVSSAPSSKRVTRSTSSPAPSTCTAVHARYDSKPLFKEKVASKLLSERMRWNNDLKK